MQARNRIWKAIGRVDAVGFAVGDRIDHRVASVHSLIHLLHLSPLGINAAAPPANLLVEVGAEPLGGSTSVTA